MKVALAMICGGIEGEHLNLDRALSSITPFVDGVFITLTGEKDKLKDVENVCKKHNAYISYKSPYYTADKKTVSWLKDYLGYNPNMRIDDKMFLFDEARNFNFQKIPKDYEWILWIDTDDIFQGGESLKTVVGEYNKQGIEAIYLDYIYQAEFDAKGNIKHILIKHLRERLIKNQDLFDWVMPIHETLIEKRPTKKADNRELKVVHLATMDDRAKSLTRNLKNLELAIYKTKGEDPRQNYYLAKAYFDLNTRDFDSKAEKLILEHYVGGKHRSGWPQERSQAWEYLGEIARRGGNHDRSIKAFVNALIEYSENPAIFLNIAVAYMLKQEGERALFWCRLSSLVPQKETTLVINPKDLQAHTLEVIYNASLNLGRIDEAWAAAEKLTEMFPDQSNITNSFKFINQLRFERDITNSMVKIANFLKQTGEAGKIKPLLASIPKPFENNPILINLFQQNNPPKMWKEDEIAIYCGVGFTVWGPTRMKDQKDSFIGGSEEAVIYMSQALVRQGWRVVVYNDCGEDEGEHDGVTYIPYYKFNRNDMFNILIGWRDIRFFDTKFKAKKTYLWSHDIQNPVEFIKERL